MIVYNSMLVVVFVLMSIYRHQAPKHNICISRPIPWGYAIIAMGYITFWAALRSGFIDTAAYIQSFKLSPSNFTDALTELHKDSKAPLWNFFQIIFKSFISQDFHYWLATIAIVSAIPITITLRKLSPDYLFSIFLFITSTIFSWMFNGIRQFVVVAILFGFYYLLIRRKRLAFIGIVLICSTIHTSAIIMLPAAFLVDFKPFGRMMSLFVFLTLLSAFFVGEMLDTMDIILQDSNYYGNLDQFAEDDGAHPLRVALESVPVILAFIKRKQIAKMNNDLINLCINMSTVSSGLMYMAVFTSGIMIGRLPIYYGMYNFILIPYLINYVYSKQRKLLYFGFYIVYVVFYFLMTQHFYYISDILGNYF